VVSSPGLLTVRAKAVTAKRRAAERAEKARIIGWKGVEGRRAKARSDGGRARARLGFFKSWLRAQPPTTWARRARLNQWRYPPNTDHGRHVLRADSAVWAVVSQQ